MEVTAGREGKRVVWLTIRKTYNFPYGRVVQQTHDLVMRWFVMWADEFFQLLPNYAMHPLKRILRPIYLLK